MHPLGIDFGGTGIKAAPVDLDTGTFALERTRQSTPTPATPRRVVEVMRELVEPYSEVGAIGVTIPGIIRQGVVQSAANIDSSWIGRNANDFLSEELQRPVRVVNDADAAGLAEATYGVAAGRSGLTILTTLGTGIGSAMIYNGELLPNSELGHLEIKGHEIEKRASNRVREDQELSWDKWAKRLTRFYRHLERIFSPDLIAIGGGVSKRSERFLHLIDIETEVVPAQLLNTAGIVGAALNATRQTDSSPTTNF